MNIYQCEEAAKGKRYDGMEFMAFFPAGPKKCKWLDADLGLFTIEDQEGFVMTREIDKAFPDLICLPME